MFRAIWRRLLAESIARSIEARTAASVDARIDAAVRRVESRLTDRQTDAVERASASARVQAERIQVELAEAVERLRTEIRAVGERIVSPHADEIAERVIGQIERARPWTRSVFVPRIELPRASSASFMTYSTCSAADFETADFARLCAELARPVQYHRKLWEWVFITHRLRCHGVAAAGKRGLGFGVGTEPLPSRFAKDGAEILATDAPPAIAIDAGWDKLNEFAATLESIRVPSIIDSESFVRLVRHASCDMNAIGDDFTGFDFCWSSCCLEHLGSLEAGIDFVVNSVEKTLRIGGVACHTTEFNLSSDRDTISEGPTVIYRRQDIERLIGRLRDRGHWVEDLRVAPDSHPLDFFVDMPPYSQDPHLKLSLMGFTSTSVGIVVRRGR